MVRPFLFKSSACLLLSVAFVCLGGCSGTKSSQIKESSRELKWSKKGALIDFERQSLAGESFRTAQYRGKVVFVTYFGTWCEPCVRLVTRLDRLAYGKKSIPGFVFLPLSVDSKVRTALRDFGEKQKLRGPLLIPNRAELRGRTPFGQLDGVPTTFIIDPRGRAVEKFVGEIPIAYLRRRVQALMGMKHE